MWTKKATQLLKNMDGMQEHQIDNHWNDHGEQPLSGYLNTRFTFLDKLPQDGPRYIGGIMTCSQDSTRSDRVVRKRNRKCPKAKKHNGRWTAFEKKLL